MDELNRKQFNKDWVSMVTSCSSQATNDDDTRKWKIPTFPLANSVYNRPSMSVVEDSRHPLMKRSNSQGLGCGLVPWHNGSSSKNVETSDVRPTKIRKTMIDLCLPADEYIDETVEFRDHRFHGTSTQLPNGNVTESRGDDLRIGYELSRSNGLVDLNEPYKARETNLFANDHSRNGEFQGHNRDYRKSRTSGSVRRHVPVNSLHPQRTYIDLEADTDTNSSYKVTHESVLASHLPRGHLYPYNPMDSTSPWNHLHSSSSQNPSFNFPQKVGFLQRFPSDYAQRQGCPVDRLQHNMFYNECSSSSKSKFFGTGYNYSSGTPSMDPNDTEKKVVRDLDLNVTLSDTSVVEATFPWLTKPKSDMADAKSNLKTIDDDTPSKVSSEKSKVHRMLDMNEPYDEDQEMEKQIEPKVRFQFDLNVTASEDEEETENQSVPISSKLNSKAKIIDLEALPVPESDDEEEETLAGETLVAISTVRELEEEVVDSENSILHCFAETVVNLEEKIDTFATDHVEEIDYFEFMTLQLPEMTEDEYMPKPLVPENLNLEESLETGMVSTSQRPRRGNARKGKQRRDFQRDFLPGIVTLSRYEVAEDAEMFEGLMRATGRSWTPIGLAKKKTGLRGRPRRVKTIPEPVSSHSVQQEEVMMGLEDGRSFEGCWSKKTRRGRRRRCSATSTPHAPVT